MKITVILFITFCFVFGEILSCDSKVCIKCGNTGSGRRKRSVEPISTVTFENVSFNF